MYNGKIKFIEMKKIQLKQQFANLVTVLLLFIISSFFKAHALNLGNKDIIGISEKIIILPGEISFKAKIDTGADNSSIPVSYTHLTLPTTPYV